MLLNTIFVDTETTSLDTEHGAIIQLAAIRSDGTTFCQTVRPHPGALIEDKALQINGRSRQELETFKTPQLVASEFLNFLKPQAPKIILAGQNLKYDWDMLHQFYKRVGMLDQFKALIHYNFLDLLPLALALQEADVLKTNRNYLRLCDLTQALGIKQEKAHDALSDIQATKQVYYKMLDLIKKPPEMNWETTQIKQGNLFPA